MITARVVFGVLWVFDLSFAHRKLVFLICSFFDQNSETVLAYTNMLARVGLFRGTAQTVTVRRTQARSALGAAKHTHCHRAPPLVALSVYLDFKGM